MTSRFTLSLYSLLRAHYLVMHACTVYMYFNFTHSQKVNSNFVATRIINYVQCTYNVHAQHTVTCGNLHVHHWTCFPSMYSTCSHTLVCLVLFLAHCIITYHLPSEYKTNRHICWVDVTQSYSIVCWYQDRIFSQSQNWRNS